MVYIVSESFFITKSLGTKQGKVTQEFVELVTTQKALHKKVHVQYDLENILEI